VGIARPPLGVTVAHRAMSPVNIVQRQLDAYNAHDLEAFVAVYSDTIEIFRMPATQPTISGKAQLTEFHATQRFNVPGLEAELVSRTVLGNKVVDHERIRGLRDEPVEIVAVYEVGPNSIERVWFFSST
jgi:hypothetical protein